MSALTALRKSFWTIFASTLVCFAFIVWYLWAEQVRQLWMVLAVVAFVAVVRTIAQPRKDQKWAPGLDWVIGEGLFAGLVSGCMYLVTKPKEPEGYYLMFAFTSWFLYGCVSYLFIAVIVLLKAADKSIRGC